MQQIGIDEFIKLAIQHPVLDVRSPGEYLHAHIPGAYNLPLFTDKEREVVGTIYKQQGQQPAIKAGLDYFGVKMRHMVEATEEILHTIFHTDELSSSVLPSKTVLVHCWRGGMRSAGVSWLLNLYGFQVYTLKGGYKAYRNWVLQQFDCPRNYAVLGGHTGSGKTGLLKAMAAKGHSIVDLEGIACHKGSAFGDLGEAPQPTQEMFENELALAMYRNGIDTDRIWLEDESRRIGHVNIPARLWEQMQAAPTHFMDVPFEARLDNLVAVYGGFDPGALVAGITRIQKRLGGANASEAISYIAAGNNKDAFRILLRYYDKCYDKGMAGGKERQVTRVAGDAVDEWMKQIMPIDKKATDGAIK